MKEEQGGAHLGALACLIDRAVVREAKVSRDFFVTISQTVTGTALTTASICAGLSACRALVQAR